MERQALRGRWKQAAVLAGAAVVLYLGRHVLLSVATQLFGGYVLMALALPLCRRLEKRMPSGAAAVISLLALLGAAVGMMLVLIPPLARQLKQMTTSFPVMMAWIETQLGRLQQALDARGMDLSPVKDAVFGAVSSRAGKAVSSLAGMAARLVQALGKVFLAPLISFYLLRDRRRIVSLLTLVLPVKHRARAVRAAREMRRETAGFLRGQLLVSAAIGVLTALGLKLTGNPGWLVLGALMGVMELVPYAGPVLAGIPAVLLALQGGIGQGVWTLLVLLAVQQIEGGVLSPRLLSGATKLHPLVVLLSVSAGGIFAGTFGMILALPVVVSVRGALRGLRK